MVNRPRLTKEDSYDIGFVKSSLIIGAITRDEFQEWLYKTIKENDVNELPSYIFNLIDFNDFLFKIVDIIGFSPNPGLTDYEYDAIYGIAIKRFGNLFDMPISKKAALKALDQHPSILKCFKETFPFIKIED